jgi:hypothetical protein
MSDEDEAATKLGRKPLGEAAMPPARRQSRARSLAMAELCDGNVKNISISNLVALLPKLISNNHSKLVRVVCDEIVRRSSSKNK